MTPSKLTFGQGNAKLNKKGLITFSLPAGYTCPGARECLARADIEKGTIVDGPEAKFRCFAASQEATYSSVRKSRWHNFDLLQAANKSGGVAAMIELINASLPSNFDTVRVHVSGDFFSIDYFKAWLTVAEEHPDKMFYAYTKSVHLWKELQDIVPVNFLLTASYGGKYDDLIEENNFISATVVFHPEEAGDKPIDHDDSHAYSPENRTDFALLLHGVQKAGSEASTAIKRLNKEGVKTGYNKNKK